MQDEAEFPALRSPNLLSRAESAVLIVDVQTKLLRLIPDRQTVLHNIHRILDGAALFEIPVLGTEQYPKGLGLTDDALRARLGDLPAKTQFSCLECRSQFQSWFAGGRRKLVVAGIETHVCILQTVLDALAYGFEVYVVVDAVAARGKLDHDTGIRRMESQGATLVTTESILFEWCEASSDPAFKQVSEIIRRPLMAADPMA